MPRVVVETESTYDVNGDPDKVRKYDPSNPTHYFIVILAHSVTFENAIASVRLDLDHENLVSIVGPYCFHCGLRPGDPELTERCNGPRLEEI